MCKRSVLMKLMDFQWKKISINFFPNEICFNKICSNEREVSQLELELSLFFIQRNTRKGKQKK